MFFVAVQRALPALFFLTSVSVLLSACHPMHPQPRYGCFNPAPSLPTAILKKRGPQLRWPSAHRGDTAAGFDNSRSAILSAVRRGMPLVEVDLRTSADGKLFLFHDRRLRQHNYEGPASYILREVESLTSEELRRLRLPGSIPEPIIFFEDALEMARGYPSALQLDLKGESTAMVSAVLELVRSTRTFDHVVVQCQSIRTAKFIREHYPGVAILLRADGLDEVEHALSLRPVPEIIQMDSEWMTTSLVEEIRAAGSHVLVKALERDTPDEWSSLLAQGTDIIMTDKAREFIRAIPRACEAR